MNTFNRNVQNITPSASMVVMAKAKKLKAIDPEIVDMGGGEPDFGTPRKICDELFKQIQAGYTHYTVGHQVFRGTKRDNREPRDEGQELIQVIRKLVLEEGSQNVLCGSLASQMTWGVYLKM